MLEVDKLRVTIHFWSGNRVEFVYPVLPCGDGLLEGFTAVFRNYSYGDIIKEFISPGRSTMEVV